jgi:hypothetical protein
MAEDNFTLTTFYTSWKAYQDHTKGALAQLRASQLLHHLEYIPGQVQETGLFSPWGQYYRAIELKRVTFV